jgi:glutamate/tyrosine decarboxylase-like PLP-dependent enzyme
MQLDHTRFLEHLTRSLGALGDWESTWGPVDIDGSVQVDPGRVEEVLGELSERLRENYPYFHPRYAGQMLKPPHPVAVLAYTTAMHINPNNHALDGGMATSRMEREVVTDLAGMLGFDGFHLGHLTGGGTVANLEALWVARSLHPDKLIVSSDQAHYTHTRVSEVIGARHASVSSDALGRIDLDALQAILDTGEVGTVVATAGTTGLGAIDQIDAIVPNGAASRSPRPRRRGLWRLLPAARPEMRWSA